MGGDRIGKRPSGVSCVMDAGGVTAIAPGRASLRANTRGIHPPTARSIRPGVSRIPSDLQGKMRPRAGTDGAPLWNDEPRVFARGLMVASATTLRARFASPVASLQSLDPGLIAGAPPASEAHDVFPKISLPQ